MTDDYQAGESCGDAVIKTTELWEDLRAIGFKEAPSDLETLLEVAKGTGQPIDDRKLLVSPYRSVEERPSN
jgi:hypothetical protein